MQEETGVDSAHAIDLIFIDQLNELG